jgi:polyisoprenyl-teichoic acid--peptidoglycan teichoic acid transferase
MQIMAKAVKPEPVEIDATPVAKKSSRKKVILLSLLAVLAVLGAAGTFMVFRVNSGVSKTFQGSVLSALVNKDPLQQDQNGNTNMLIFGNSSDDPNHGGALLADSIMVLSVNHKTKTAKTLSIPRDLWVKYDGACTNGSEGKINAVYPCALRKNNNDKRAAGRALADKVGSVLGIEVQYYAEVNYTFVRSAVDAVGGVDVVIKSSDPRGILDRTFDKDCPNGPNTCYRVKYENGPAHLNGQQALDLSRARNAHGGYGLPRSNFDRELNQQMILVALQQKALSAGVLANPARVISMTDSLGDNITTNIKTSELQSAIDILKAIDSSNVQSIPLNDPKKPLVKTGTQSGQSIVLPAAGLYNYSVLQATIQEAFSK